MRNTAQPAQNIWKAREGVRKIAFKFNWGWHTNGSRGNALPGEELLKLPGILWWSDGGDRRWCKARFNHVCASLPTSPRLQEVNDAKVYYHGVSTVLRRVRLAVKNILRLIHLFSRTSWGGW